MSCPNGNLFKINTKDSLYFLNNSKINTVLSRELNQWHTYLGHPNHEEILHLPHVTENMIITHKNVIKNCDTCLKSKMCKNISKAPDERGKRPFAKVHMDLVGPINQENCIDGEYLFGDVCDFSHFFTYLL